jgi:hypothetical protein
MAGCLVGYGEPEFPDQPRPGADLHRTRPRRAASLGITERSAHGIVADLAEAGYLIRQKDGRRNRYQIQAHLPLPEAASQEPAIRRSPRRPGRPPAASRSAMMTAQSPRPK